jgi:hypothetical protein
LRLGSKARHPFGICNNGGPRVCRAPLLWHIRQGWEGVNVTEDSVAMAIQALEALMDEEEGRGQAKHVVMFRVFVGQRNVGGLAPFFLDADAANNYYNDLVRNIKLEAISIHPKATRAIVTLHDKRHEWPS